MNKKAIKTIVIASAIVTVTLAFKNLAGNTTKFKSVSLKNSKKILGVADAANTITMPNNETSSFIVRGFYKSVKNVDNALIVTLSSTAKDSGSFQLLPCYFVDEKKPQLNDIPFNSELVITGNPLPIGGVAQITDCNLISINIHSLSVDF